MALPEATRKITPKDNEKIIVPVVLGPTAVGKTGFVLRAAEALGYGVVSCDSRQIYKGMDIGTAKPSIEERKCVTHWLIDILAPSQAYSAFAFASDALRIIREARAAKKKILICGGTGLYFHLLENGAGLSSGLLDEADIELRGALQKQASERGAGELYERLRKADPEAASKIHPNDVQRILRALDIIYRKGEPISTFQEAMRPPEDIQFRTIVITRPRDALYERINSRVDSMFEQGLWEEFRTLRESGYTETSPGMICVGYRELFDVERGETSLKQAAERIKQNSRRYAKRQMTWFRNKTKAERYVEVHGDDSDFLYEWLN